MARVTVSQSKAKSWRQCKQQFHYKYVELLTKKKVRRPFQFGRIVHSMIEAFANGDDPFEELDKIDLANANMFAAERETYGNIIGDIRTIMEAYFEHWPEDSLQYVRKNGRGSEHEFEIELPGTGVFMKGKIDAIVKANGLRWLGEHKTFARMPKEDQRWRNLQSCVYIRAIDLLGWKPVDGTVWDYIRSKPPAVPEILKSGELSTKKIDTLPNVVRAVLADHPDTDGSKLIEMAKSNVSSYFVRVFTPTSRSTVDMIFADFISTAREISEKQGSTWVRNIGQHCDFCDYEPLCRAELQGSDVDFLKKREYVKDGGKAKGKVNS